jgi:hypothetical protein
VAGVKTEVDVAWAHFAKSSLVDKWIKDNPGEFDKIENYRKSDSTEPEGIKSEFGLGMLSLVNAGKLGDGTYQPVGVY